MTGRILIGESPVGVFGGLSFGYRHLYLIYQQPDGREFVIEGFPQFSATGGVNIAVVVGTEATGIVGTRFNEREIDLGGRQASDVWNIALQQASIITTANIPYNPFDIFLGGQNSNSAIASVLNAVGIDVRSTLPPDTTVGNFSGITNLLSPATTLVGTPANDIIVGGAQADLLSGGAGDDRLRGNQGNDRLDGGAGTSDTALFAGAASEYNIRVNRGGSVSITHARGDRSDGTDTLTNIELLEFADRRARITPTGLSSLTDFVLLQDLSGSFRADLPVLRSLAQPLINTLVRDDPNTRFAVASFVDKPQQPFGASTDFVYQTNLPLTISTSRVTSALNALTPQNGLDTPEAQLEALLQTALRGSELGYRDGSTRYVMLSTDAPFHLAGDGASGRPPITVPNNGDAIVDPNEDYPSIAQVRAALEANSVIPIFAVTADVRGTYEELISSLGRGVVVTLTANSSNFTDAIRQSLSAIRREITAIGTPGDDIILGTRRYDGLFGDLGDDRLSGVRGDDLLDGGAGRDILRGGIGRDRLRGGSGADRVLGGRDADLLEGSLGNDVMFGGDGDDRLNGEEGNDRLDGGAGDDRVNGGTGRDRLRGGTGDDVLNGGQGRDILIGVNLAGANPGQGEVDILISGAGRDLYVLGDRSRVYYNDGDPDSDGQDDYALIQGFNLNQRDRIQLSGQSRDYFLEEITIGSQQGAGIFWTGDGGEGELIGLIKGIAVSAIALSNATQFQYRST